MSNYFKWDTGLSSDIGARVYNNAAIEIADSVATALTFNSERWDTAAMHSVSSATNQLVCKVAGTYLIGCNVRWEANASGVRDVGIRLNGSTYITRVYMSAGASINHMQSLSTVYDLAVNDYVEVIVGQNSGGPLDVQSNANYSPEFWIQKLA